MIIKIIFFFKKTKHFLNGTLDCLILFAIILVVKRMIRLFNKNGWKNKNEIQNREDVTKAGKVWWNRKIELYNILYYIVLYTISYIVKL